MTQRTKTVLIIAAAVLCLIIAVVLCISIFGNTAPASQEQESGDDTMKHLKMVVNLADCSNLIHKEIYGQFIEHAVRIINDGLFVGKDSPIPNHNGVRLDIIEGYKEIGVPMLHWPGGAEAELYHWRYGIGSNRKSTVNAWTGRKYSNDFGTHEFLDLCEELQCEPYIVFNVNTGTAQEAADWIEYITSDKDTEMTRLRRANGRDKPWTLNFTCMGNEWWGYEDAAAFAKHFKEYNSYALRNCPTNPLRFLRGPQHFLLSYTEDLISQVEPGSFDALTLYLMVTSSDTPEEFTDDEYYLAFKNTLQLDEYMTRHLGIVRGRDANAKAQLVIDEWGVYYPTEDLADDHWYVETTQRDALIAGVVLNMFNNRCDIVRAACNCMSINALQSVMLTQGDKMIKTPTYYVFKMYRDHQDAHLVSSFVEQEQVGTPNNRIPAISQSVSIKDGKVLMTLVNCSLDEDYQIDAKILYGAFTQCEGEILQSDPHRGNHFDDEEKIESVAFNDFSFTDDGITVHVPCHSIVSLHLSN